MLRPYPQNDCSLCVEAKNGSNILECWVEGIFAATCLNTHTFNNLFPYYERLPRSDRTAVFVLSKRGTYRSPLIGGRGQQNQHEESRSNTVAEDIDSSYHTLVESIVVDGLLGFNESNDQSNDQIGTIRK